MNPATPTFSAPRPAVKQDLPEILELADALVRHDRNFDPSLDSEYNRSDAGTEWYTHTLTDPDSCVRVIENAGGKLAGLLIGRMDEPVPWRKIDGRFAELEILSVAPEARSGGIGRTLLADFAQWARKRGAVRIWGRVSAGNADAIRFYKRELFADYDVILERAL